MLITSSLFSLIIFVLISAAHNQGTDYQCFDQQDTKSWILHSNTGISYIYLSSNKTFMIYNNNLGYSLTIDSPSKTLGVFNVNAGFGGIVNMKPVQGYFAAYIPLDNLKGFDMSKVERNNCENVTAHYDYIASYIPYLTGVDATRRNLGNFSMMLEDCARTTDVSTWPSYGGNQVVINLAQKYYMKFINFIHEMYATHIVSLADGLLVCPLFVSDYCNSPDARSKLLAEFALYLVKDLNGEINEDIMAEFYELMRSEKFMELFNKEFAALKELAAEAGSKYGCVSQAMKAYRAVKSKGKLF